MLPSFWKSNLEGFDMRIMGRKGTRIRVMEVACLTIFAISTLCGAASEAGPTGANPPSASADPQLDRSLKVLYAGRPGCDREKDFVTFLKKYFDVVQTGNLQTFKEADTQGFDVTILDWDTSAPFSGPRPVVSARFSRPIMTLGVTGACICSRWRLKTGYS